MSNADAHLEKRAATTGQPSNRSVTSHKLRNRNGRHFVSHEGRRVHIASSPQEAETIRKRLQNLEEPFDLYLHGSPEHLDVLQKTHSHHEQSRSAFQVRHGDIYDEFHRIHSELDWLVSELESVTNHGVRLDANFSKYGYSAHLRSYDDSSEDTPTLSARSSISEADRPAVDYVSPLKFFKVPVVRQYFHKGLIWRAAEQQDVESFELFVDLLYVGIIATIGDYASEEPTGLSLLRFIITFTMSYKVWTDMTLMISWFDANDVTRRLSILFTLACLFGFTTNITSAFSDTYAQLVGFYLTARLFTACYMLYMALLIRMVRAVLIVNIVSIVLCATIWVGSIYVDWPDQLALIFVALVLDMLTQTSYFYLISMMKVTSAKTRAWAEKTFEFWPALNIEHKIERTNAFVSLIFGYSVVALLFQNRSHLGLNAFFGKAILGLIQAFCFNWLYFEIDAANISMHAIRRHKVSAFIWLNAHLPFIMSFILAGGALARLVVASDCADADPEDLAETYQQRSTHDIEPAIRWFYCGGLGVALASMGFIALTHIHKETSGLRMMKKYRIAVRFFVAIVFVCLPLAKHLNSLELVGTTTSLVVIVLGTELWCASCCHDKLWDTSKCCGYVGDCPKGDLAAMKRKLEGDSDVETLSAGNNISASIAH